MCTSRYAHAMYWVVTGVELMFMALRESELGYAERLKTHTVSIWLAALQMHIKNLSTNNIC